MARQMTWHERREINLRIQRREGRLQSDDPSRPNPSTGIAATRRQAPGDATETASGELDDGSSYPQPLQGFDYTSVG